MLALLMPRNVVPAAGSVNRLAVLRGLTGQSTEPGLYRGRNANKEALAARWPPRLRLPSIAQNRRQRAARVCSAGGTFDLAVLGVRRWRG